jgi:hypothetical protein
MTINDGLGEIYDVQLDYVGNVATVTWITSGDTKTTQHARQKDVVKDILSRPQDIKKSNIFERRFLIKKTFEK